MISLGRANGILAKIVSGYTLQNNLRVGYHNWVEVYLEKNGWTPFDPTFADAENSYTSFYSMFNEYVYLSNSMEHIHNYKDYAYRSKNHKLKLQITPRWKEITKIKYFEAIKSYNGNDDQKTKKLFDTLLIVDPENINYVLFQGVTNARLGNFNKANILLQKAWTIADNEVFKIKVIYAFSNFYSLKGDVESALSYLERAIEMGYDRKELILQDRDLVAIKDMPRFKEIIERIE